MSPRRRLVVLSLLALAGFLLWWAGHRRLEARRAALEAQRAELAVIRERAITARSEAERLQEEIDAERGHLADATARAASRAVPTPGSESGSPWNAPPATLPDWNPKSPYVWIPKSLLRDIPVEPFHDSGVLEPGLGAMLALDPERERVLNAEVSRLVEAARHSESDAAMLSPVHPDPIHSQAGEKITLEVPSATGESLLLRAELEQTLLAELGDSRSELLLHWGRNWMDQEFGSPDAPPRVYSVIRHPDATFGLRVQTGMGGMSVDGTDAFLNYIPMHLRGWFRPLADPPPPQSP